jgi:hypothetical protein
MNVFVLSTGRCGSETFARACGWMTNYTSAHESHSRWLHPYAGMPYRDLHYPDNHIEVDNRLSWFLGTLEKTYGQQAFYVHLLRRREEVARSLVSRGEHSILHAFAAGVLQYYGDARFLSDDDRYLIGLQYWDSVNDNIELFLRDKPRKMTMWLDRIKDPFHDFWYAIGAEGDLQSALAEWDIKHNVTRTDRRASWAGLPSRNARLEQAIADIAAAVPERETFLLADEEQWGVSRVVAGRPRLPFPERGGQYWGTPTDDAGAVNELEACRDRGLRYLVIGWPAFWWFDHYREFARQLRADCRCLAENDRVAIFDLLKDHR